MQKETAAAVARNAFGRLNACEHQCTAWKYKSFVLVLYTTLNWVNNNYNNDAVFQMHAQYEVNCYIEAPNCNGALRVTTPDPDMCCRGLGGSSFSDLSGPGAKMVPSILTSSCYFFKFSL